MKTKIFFIIAAIACFWQVSSAQPGISYQGSLKNAGAPANGNHDFEFRLWDSESGGVQVGTTVTLNGVAVTNGIFSVTLAFGNQFPNAPRYLEVRVRPTGGGAFTTLTPREQIKAVPYAVTSLNAEQLGGLSAPNYITVANATTSFIINSTTQQASSNFNISGNGTVSGILSGNTVNAGTQYTINGARVVSIAGTENLFAGVGAGAGNTIGLQNSYFGFEAGSLGLGGNANSYFGWRAGRNNNSSNNSFFGHNAGVLTANGESNTFIGQNTGTTNTSGSGNTFLGTRAAALGSDFTNATAIGNRAFAGASNTIVLGGVNGVNGCNPVNFCDTVNVGIGTTSPSERLHVVGNAFFTGGNVGVTGNGTFNGSVGIGTITPGHKLHVVGENIRVEGNTTSIFPRFSLNFTGGGADAKKWQNYASTDRLRFTALNDAENSENIWLDVVRSGLSVTGVNFLSGIVSINQLGNAGATTLCRNTSNQISTCSSSKRYKQNINSYSSGLSLIKQLRPVSFNWKSGGMADLGLVAEEVADIEPLLTTTNDKGEVEGVKYDRIGVIAVNAIKEQQAEISGQRSVISGQQRQIEDLSSQVKDQQKQIDALKKLVCAQNPAAEICMEEK